MQKRLCAQAWTANSQMDLALFERSVARHCAGWISSIKVQTLTRGFCGRSRLKGLGTAPCSPSHPSERTTIFGPLCSLHEKDTQFLESRSKEESHAKNGE